MIKYSDFISEKKENLILEAIGETFPFVLSSELGELMEDISENISKYAKIAKIYLDLDLSRHEKLNMSYLDIGDDNQSIKFLDPKKVQKIKSENGWSVQHVFNNIKSSNSIKIGRLTKKVIELYNKKNKTNVEFTTHDIEKFVNAYKSHYDFKNNKFNSFKLVDGPLIVRYYNEENYQNSTGTLGSSCMKYDSCSGYFQMYSESKNIKLLVLKAPSERITGRALIWELKDGTRFMDRVYTNRDSDRGLFVKWAEENNCSYKLRQNSVIGHVCTPEKNWDPTPPSKQECDVIKVDFERRSMFEFPYMDTLKYYYFKEGIVANYEDDSRYYVVLEDTEGWCYCNKCDNEGSFTCDECSGGSVNCGSCSGSGCDDCEELGWVDCPDCKGDIYIKCDRCDGFSE